MAKSIDGKYQVFERIGDGFGGSVFLVESQGKKLALKQLKMRSDHDCLSPEEILDNFKQEFSTLKKLNHPHILSILDFGFDAQQDCYYFTTEYIPGEDIFKATRDLPYEEVEELFVQTFRALSYLHSQKVYHLDIKPSNILVSVNKKGKKTAKIIDFGLTAFWKKGILAGSPGFMAPETLLEERRDGRADLYSLAVTWYTCLTGKNPFEGKDIKETITLQKVWVPSAISQQSPKVPVYLDAIMEKLLRKNPAERYHRADQVIRDLNWSGSHQYPLETDATALAYLPGEGRLVGREKEWAQLLEFFDGVFKSRGESPVSVMISGPPGTGKSRLLTELKYHVQLQTIPVIDVAEPPLPDVKHDSVLLMDNFKPEYLDSVGLWLRQVRRHAVLLVVAGSDSRQNSVFEHRIALDNFNREEVEKFIASVLGADLVPEYLVSQLLARSKGNPLLLKEILHSIILSHQIFDERGRWSPALLKEVGLDFSKLQVPKTLKEFCESKFNLLSPDSQKVLIAVALSKAPLDRATLEKIGFEMPRSQWTFLEEESIISIESSSGIIKLLNPSFQDWIHQNVALHTLATVHQALGNYFSQKRGAEEAAWFHLGFGLCDKKERFKHLIQYGEALLRKTRCIEATKVFDAASALAPAQENRVDAQLRKSRALVFAGQHQEALKLLEELQTLLKKESKDVQKWQWIQQTYGEMCNIYLKLGRLDLARESLQVARVLLEDSDKNLVLKMILDNFKASLLMREGKLKEASLIFERNHREWDQWPLEDKKSVINNELATVYLSLKNAEEAKRLFQAEASFYQAIGNMNKRAYAIYGWAESCCMLNQFDEANNIYQFCIDLSRELKNEELLLHAYTGLGNIANFEKDWKRCVGYYQNSLELAQHQVNSDYSLAISINLAIVFRQLHENDNARLYLDHVIDTLEAQSSPSLHQLELLTQAYIELGRFYSENYQWFEARDAFRDAVRIVRHHGSLKGFHFTASLGLAKADVNLDRNKEAQEVLARLEKRNLSKAERSKLEDLKKVLWDSNSSSASNLTVQDPPNWETITVSFKTTL